MKFRDASEIDLPAIVQIYNASIPDRLATADIKSVSLESRIGWFRDRSFTTRPIWVMEIEGVVAGWLSFQSFYGRPAYSKTVELSLYVSPNYRRRGIAQKLLTQAIARSPSLGIATLLGFIFAHNQPSLELFTKYQFQRWGYLPNVAVLDGIERDLVILGRRV